MTIYAIGDIHGHLGLLHAAHARIEADRARTGAETAKVVHVGDLVDRGPNSAGVVDYLSRQAASDTRVIVLRGNHDQMFLDWLTSTPRDDGRRRAFLDDRVGGRKTLASYRVGPDLTAEEALTAAQVQVPRRHRAFLESLPYFYRDGPCFFVHAGIRPDVPLNQQSPHDMMWIRDQFLVEVQDFGALIVHGHTPDDGAVHYGNRLSIDSGVAFGGPLSAVAIEGRSAFLLTPSGREPLVPRR